MEHIPKYLKNTAYLFKSLNTNVCEKICQYVMLLWREFYIAVEITAKIEYFTIRVRHRNKNILTERVEKPVKLLAILKNLVKEYIIQKEDIK